MQKQSYDQNFYEAQKSGSYRSAAVIVPIISNLMPVRSVCDVGCGVGTWLRCWQEHGVRDVLGIDGSYVDKDQLMIPAADFQPADLRQPVRCDRRFDLVMSMEVAEHLPQDRAASFVADLTSLAPVVVFSAAVPGQGGIDHVNERWQGYWATLFNQRGFTTFDVLRPKIWDNDEVEFWYSQNTLLFCRDDVVDEYPALSSAAVSPLSLVHPALLRARVEDVLGIRKSLTALSMALRRAAADKISRSWSNAKNDGRA